MKKIKLRYIWLIIVILIALAFLIVYGCTQTSGNLNTFMIVLLAIDFLVLTGLVQYAGMRSFRYNPKKHYKTLTVKTDVNNIRNNLKKLKYDEKKFLYGYNYLIIDGENALKVTIINDSKEYFEPTDKTESKPRHELDKCKRFIDFEIFLDLNDEYKDRLSDFSLQGKNIYFTAFSYNKDEDILKCDNYVKPDSEFEPAYQKLFNDLGFKKVE